MGYMQAAQFYSTLVGSGQMSMGDAADALSKESGGGLTPFGARSVIADPIASAVQIANFGDNARAELDRMRGGQ